MGNIVELKINLDTLSSNGIKAILDVSADCWSNTQGIMMNADYGYISDEEADMQVFDCCKQAVELVKVAQKLDDIMGIKKHNIEEKKLAAVQNREPEYCKGIMEYSDRCYIQYAINEYNKQAENNCCEKFDSPWSESDIDNNYEAHWEPSIDELSGLECKRHLTSPRDIEPEYLSEDVVIENLGPVSLKDIEFNDYYSVIVDAEAETCYYWINTKESAETLKFNIESDTEFTINVFNNTKRFEVTENSVKLYRANGELIQSGKIIAKEI